ncbi:MAG: energy transducer TonB [Bacteroidota bacterium]
MTELFRKWISGDSSWEAEKKLRRKATKDPFLAEAMEGYDAFPEGEHAAAIRRLRVQLPTKKRRSVNKSFDWSRVAAAAALVGVISLLFYVQEQLNQPAILRDNLPSAAAEPLQNMATPVPESEPAAADDVISLAEKMPVELPEKVLPKIKKKITPLPAEKIGPANKPTKIQSVESSSPENYAIVNDLIAEQETLLVLSEEEMGALESSSADVAVTTRARIARKQVLPNTAFAPTSTLVDSSIAAITNTKIAAPTPVGGFEAFTTYINEQLVYPAEAKEKGLEREVEVRFYIDEEGKPYQVEVDSIGQDGLAKEAIRLILEGPKWQPVNASATYVIKFEL